jgi:5-methylcytosine-specific restriction protein B
MAEDKVRRSLLLKTAMEILRDHGGKMRPSEVLEELGRRIALNLRELSLDNSGLPRFDRAVGFDTGYAATIGWTSKIGGWSITDAGIETLETYPEVDELWTEFNRLYREIDQRRKQALQSLSEVDQFIATALQFVEPGTWTAHDDLAELADTSPKKVADFLAGTKVKLPTSYRVLNADGTIPSEEFLHANYRGSDLRQRLSNEGVIFDAAGTASHEQRLTAADLKLRLSERADDTGEGSPSLMQRAWMVRGTSVDGYNLVHEWLQDGFVSLSVAQLTEVAPGVSYDELKAQVETAYQHKSYAYRGQRLEELDRFIRWVREGDLVLTSVSGRVFIGRVGGAAYFTDHSAQHSNLRRSVHWLNSDAPLDAKDLQAPVPALLQSQAYVVDLTEAYGQLAGLTPLMVEEPPGPVPEPKKEQRTLSFNSVTAEAAADLLMDRTELQKVAELLWERKQVIFYGPPGTGKTYLAKTLARHLSEDGAVRLVQFHPSYTYEDFFEGFRPKSPEGGTGALMYELKPGPFRLFAETAKANPTTPYILIIDEINRANLAKVFGELYFLLEYRDEAISLQYSPKEEFTLPPNLYIIGTMNTSDRSVARIDSAMRRRFAFIEIDPRIPPVQGLLSRWLAKNELPSEGGRLLDALNDRLADADAAIGPSYLMRTSIYERPDGLERVWQYEIMPLLEDLFYGETALSDKYGLESLRRAIESP